jgi:hypothetical protein
MPGGDEIRDVQRATWAGLSAGREKWDSVIMDQLGPVGAAMIERARLARRCGACPGRRTGAGAYRGSRHRQGQHLRT